MHRLDNPVQTYAWGHPRAIWELLGRDTDGPPGAELWMGAHPVAPSRLAGDADTLAALIERDPVAALGPETAERFGGRLPFLFKVLAAGEALSLQAHPDAARARAGFEREEAAGLPFDHPDRTYRDPSHKPELICAVTPFEARCGFRDPAATIAVLDDLDQPALIPLRSRLTAAGPAAEVLAGALRWLLSLPPEEAAALVAAVAAGAEGPGSGRSSDERASMRRLAARHPGDPGVVVALLLNHVRLAPGEALFLAAGNLHCYLEGVGVEIMANSDNVVRGGLTSKRIDVPELLAVVDAAPIDAPVQRPAGPVHTYRSPIDEFALTRLALDGSVDRAPGARIVLVLRGRAEVEVGAGRLELRVGQSAWVAWADGPVRLRGTGLVYEAAPGATADRWADLLAGGARD